ncbi:GHKL domain-containing protein [Colwellia sp. D2M02]|uniref:sensor histidine kinase n=1 Tax=Colwellia sp. D2M02 TaxID=2841562 RepID=UPI001C0A06EE|nr:ATP-binding protein [Colwellia sp. D2M02]MBU2892340.1 GHKL domain-containing protein [Colwellia sp. D2M02]
MGRLALSLLSVVLIATIGLGWMFDSIYNQYQASFTTISSSDKTQPIDNISTIERLGENLAITVNQLTDKATFIQKWPKKNGFTLSLLPLKALPLPEVLLSELKAGQPLLLETDEYIALHFYLSSSNELLVLKTIPMAEPKNSTYISILLTSLFYLAVLLLMFLWLYPLAKRLFYLRQAAKSFGEGDLTQRINVGSVSYIRDLELEFNRMAQRIEDLVADIKLLSGAVSHDLRTPLARIRFGIDTIAEEDDPILRRRFEQRISDNVDEMVDLVETLLNYARLDQTLLTLDKTQIDFSALVARCISNKSQDNVRLHYQPPTTPIMVYGDLSYLMILVANLLQNAYQHCQGKIDVTIKESNTHVELTITDDGSGIAPEQREQILKPFIRGESSKKVKGYGMGLAIVKRIVQWHQGSLIIDNSTVLHGAQFTVTLPRN